MTSKPKLLIIDDDENIRTQMKWALAQDYEVFLAGERAGALEVLAKESPCIVCLDLGLPPDARGVSEGFRILSEIRKRDALIKVIVVTGRDEKEHALRGIDEGAYDFFCKPVQIDDLKVVLKRAVHVSILERENRESQYAPNTGGFEGILGTSPQMQKVFATIRKVATTDATVLILGESGTGKELVARAIHRLSTRRERPFVTINCGAIPENLIESELFGHEKGSFTGAHMQRKGRIESAQAGTLFLDEIGDLPLPLQVKLLRFLQEQTLVRIGGREEISIDARTLAATNADLNNAMQQGSFREDLYFRLSVVVIALPPLRERSEDIGLLAKSFLDRFAPQAGRKVKGFSPQAMKALESHHWPGNVRELENRVKRAVIMADGPKLTPADLSMDSPHTGFAGQKLKDARELLEREMVQRALSRNKGNITQAAAELGISRPTLYELMDKLGIARN
jgi:two-component system NtrC family response regulator